MARLWWWGWRLTERSIMLLKPARRSSCHTHEYHSGGPPARLTLISSEAALPHVLSMAKLITALLVFLVLCITGCVLGQEDRFYFSINPEPVTSVVSGRPVTLRCKASAEAGLAYYWQLNNRPLTNTTRRFQKGPDLHITRVDRERDAGEFTCIASNNTSGFSLTSQSATLNILWLTEDVAVQLQSPDNPSSGNDVTLRCSTDGSGELKIEWFRNLEKIVRNDRHTMKGKKLHIRGATPADNGVFKCVTHNEAGTVDSTTNYALAIPGEGYPLGRVFPSKQIVKKGDGVKFDCGLEGAEETQWFFGKDNSALAVSEKYSIHQNGSLVIHKVSSEDEGIYRCVGVAAKKVAYSAELQLAFLEPFTEASLEPQQPHFIAVVAEKSEFEVTCLPSKGVPKPRVWWKAPNGRVVSDSGPIRVDESRLIIDSARVENSGNYSCEEENMAGTSSISLQIYVSTAPVIFQDPVTITVDEGAHASLSCLFRAPKYPITTVRWRKDSGNGHFKYLPEDFSGRHNNGTLMFTSVQVLDKGTYQCEVTTKGFKSIYSKKAHIYVNEKLKFNPRPVNKKFELGSSVKLYCKAQGADRPVVRWMRDNYRMFEFPEHIQDVNGTLHFTKVLRTDKGKYTCVATNSQGIINATIDVDVIVAPKFIVVPQNPMEAVEGNPVMFHCVVEGDPKPTVQWDKDTKINSFDKKRITVLENNTLLISEVIASDEARYGCTAGNSGGFRREEVQLIVRSRDYVQNMGGADAEDEGAVMTRTVTITLSAAAAYMLLVVGLMVWCRYRRLRRKQSYLQSGATPEGTLLTKAENGDTAVVEKTELRGNLVKPYREPRHLECAEGGSQSHSSNGSGGHKKSRSSFDKLSFPRQDLNKILTLGHGQFGEVFVAKAKGMRGSISDEEGVVVMVKSLQTRDEISLQEFKREMDMFHKLRHEHIVRLLGLCRDADPHFMITEYTDWGDLKQLLLATTAAVSGSKKDHKGLPPPLTMAQMVQLALQVARGMEHLSNQRMTHRDLAARNVLITSSQTVKIASVGLSKDTYSHEYIKHHDIMKPVRWMPYEAVFEDDFSTKSDVWSFAVLFWEMVHAGETPQAKHPDDAVVSLLNKRELQWRPPKAAPEPLQVILRACWSESPRDRPSFAELVSAFEAVCVDSQI
ncbi:inactive tyrosine-protein kinase 7-like [Neocloeon triangulifer]|uniref:inactive tyrosine-protein kinase 7-like n=1 Tax=Neocloeon triangulifer TaxID=2078957 RepID=UPI00286F45C9|nr:inactive tyrosine-protein kinase 7-like [Neocloeon triangulifer]